MADVSWRLFRQTSQLADSNHTAEREDLALAWAFQTEQTATIKSSPLLVDGILYFTVPDNIWAVDARSGHQIWHYTYPPNPGLHIGHRGVAMYKGYLFFLSPDAHLVSLNAKDGTVRWKVTVADATKGYWTTMAPLVVGNHVLVGVSGDFDNLSGFIRSIDPETGATQWQWDSTPPAGTPNQTTGGMTWMTGTYDSALNLVYWGTGNPTPVLNGSTRPGDNLYTCAIVALNPDTGKLVWSFQASPHDTHDWDAVETPVLVDADFHGEPKKMLMQTSRNGYFFVLDRTTGKDLLTAPFGPVNWSLGIDKQGRPIPNPAKEPAPDGRLVAPDEGGMTNYRSPSFDTKNGLFIVDAQPSYSIYFAKPADGSVRLGRRRLWRLEQRRDRGHRLPNRQDSLEPRSWTRWVGRGSADDRFRPHLHRRRSGKLSGLGFERWQNSLACGLGLPHRELSDYLRTRRPPILADQQRGRIVCMGASNRAMKRFGGNISSGNLGAHVRVSIGALHGNSTGTGRAKG